MFEVLVLLEHRSFVDVIVGSNAVVMGILGELSNIQRIVPADVHVEEHHVAVCVLLLQQMLQVLAHGYDGFRQARLLVPGIDGEVKDGGSSVSQTVGNIRPQESAVGTDVDPESFFGLE